MLVIPSYENIIIIIIEATPISVETASEDRNVVLFKSIPVTTVPIPVNLLLIS